MKASDFRKIKKILKLTNSKSKINKKAGISFKIHKYRKRKVFFVFPFIIIVLLIFLSGFIWNIEFLGSIQEGDKEEIVSILKKNGVSIGTKKKNINGDLISNTIRLEKENISWVGIKVKGTNLIIEIAEAREKPNIIKPEQHCNIVAKEDGIIESIVVQNGTAKVQKGDVVEKGDILVEGMIEGKYTGSRKVHARADLVARVWKEKKEKIDKNNFKNVETGRKEKYYQISINNFSINFNKRLSKFEKYDTITNSNRLKLTNNFYLPITYAKITNIEMKSDTTEESLNKAKEKTISKLEDSLKKENSALEIIDKQITTEETHDFIEIKVIYEVLDRIGVEEKLE